MVKQKESSDKIKKELVRVEPETKRLVEMAIIGTSYTLGSFYDEAAKEKLKKIKK